MLIILHFLANFFFYHFKFAFCFLGYFLSIAMWKLNKYLRIYPSINTSMYVNFTWLGLPGVQKWTMQNTYRAYGQMTNCITCQIEMQMISPQKSLLNPYRVTQEVEN